MGQLCSGGYHSLTQLRISLILLSPKFQRKISRVCASDHWSYFLLVKKINCFYRWSFIGLRKNHVIYIDSYKFKIAIEWFSFVVNLQDQTTIFELKINSFIHANIIKEKKIVNYRYYCYYQENFLNIKISYFFLIFSNLICEKPPIALHYFI